MKLAGFIATVLSSIIITITSNFTLPKTDIESYQNNYDTSYNSNYNAKESFGNIRLIYPDTLEGTDVKIDSKEVAKIEEIEDIFFDVGMHRLVIEKVNMDPIIMDIDVKERKVVEVDIINTYIKKCIFTFNVNVDDYYVDIKKDDGTVDTTYTNCSTNSGNAVLLHNNKLELSYGNYVMTFRKKGYKTITVNVTIDTQNYDMHVNMTGDGTN